SGDGTCEGDSGSSAFEQRSFDSGDWVSFGVLSRGGVSSDGMTCLGAIYTRFDAWGTLVEQVAIEAANTGGYTVPTWAQNRLPNGTACNEDSDCASNDCLAPDSNSAFTCVACDDTHSCNTGLSCDQGVCVAAADAGDEGGANGAGPGGKANHAGGCAIAAAGF